VVVLILLLIIELYLLNRILKYFLLSPIYLYVIFSLFSIIITIAYFYFYDDKFSLFNLDDVSQIVFLKTIKIYIIALISFIGGVLLYYDFSKKYLKKVFNKSYTDSLFFKYIVPLKTLIIARVLFLLIIILFIITYGSSIFIRSDYLPETNRGLTVLIKILSFIEIILLGIIFKGHKHKSLFYFILLLLISIGTGSRSAFLLYFVYITILFISSGNTLKNKISFSLNIFLSLVFLAYLMQLRMLNTHGVIPYIKSIVTSNEDFSETFFFNIYYSLVYGVFVTIKTIEEAQKDWNIIFISLNPFPGSMVGWYNYADDMRINLFAPYSLHGRVFKMGIGFTIIYFFVTGLIFSFMEKKIRYFLNEGKRVVAFIITLLLILHIIYGFEYNLRSAFRYIYYAFFIIFIVYLFKYIRPYLLKKKSTID